MVLFGKKKPVTLRYRHHQEERVPPVEPLCLEESVDHDEARNDPSEANDDVNGRKRRRGEEHDALPCAYSIKVIMHPQS
jgi:hypothetical protein